MAKQLAIGQDEYFQGVGLSILLQRGSLSLFKMTQGRRSGEALHALKPRLDKSQFKPWLCFKSLKKYVNKLSNFAYKFNHVNKRFSLRILFFKFVRASRY